MPVWGSPFVNAAQPFGEPSPTWNGSERGLSWLMLIRSIEDRNRVPTPAKYLQGPVWWKRSPYQFGRPRPLPTTTAEKADKWASKPRTY